MKRADRQNCKSFVISSVFFHFGQRHQLAFCATVTTQITQCSTRLPGNLQHGPWQRRVALCGDVFQTVLRGHVWERGKVRKTVGAEAGKVGRWAGKRWPTSRSRRAWSSQTRAQCQRCSARVTPARALRLSCRDSQHWQDAEVSAALVWTVKRERGSETKRWQM